MNNKDKLQKELLAKIKPGTKPSDLKRPRRIIKPKSPKDDGYESDQSNKSVPKAPALPNQNLLDQITALQKQLQLYKDFKASDLKIKEGYKETIAELTVKNQSLNKTISELKNQTKTKAENKPEPKEPTETKTFLCSECNQTKPTTELSRVFGSFLFCLECSKKARQTATQQKQKPNPEPLSFTCVVCEEPKQAVPIYQKVDISYKTHLVKGQAYPICSLCAIHVKEYNEHENQEFSIGED